MWVEFDSWNYKQEGVAKIMFCISQHPRLSDRYLLSSQTARIAASHPVDEGRAFKLKLRMKDRMKELNLYIDKEILLV